LRARSSAEEHYLDMVGVTGSIPVAPTSFHNQINLIFGDHVVPSGSMDLDRRLLAGS
jgi:hypothetical protein